MAYVLVWCGVWSRARLVPRAMPPSVSRKVFRFGVFEFDNDAAELRKQGVKVKLQDQSFKILQLLLERPGEIVTRDELCARVWAANTFVEFDQGPL